MPLPNAAAVLFFYVALQHRHVEAGLLVWFIWRVTTGRHRMQGPGFAAEEAGWLQRMVNVFNAPQSSFAAVLGLSLIHI